MKKIVQDEKGYFPICPTNINIFFEYIFDNIERLEEYQVTFIKSLKEQYATRGLSKKQYKWLQIYYNRIWLDLNDQSFDGYDCYNENDHTEDMFSIY